MASLQSDYLDDAINEYELISEDTSSGKINGPIPPNDRWIFGNPQDIASLIDIKSRDLEDIQEELARHIEKGAGASYKEVNFNKNTRPINNHGHHVTITLLGDEFGEGSVFVVRLTCHDVQATPYKGS